jgi:transcriptional regulator
MRHNPNYAVSDEGVVRQLIADNPWATLVSHDGDGVVASHYPMLLDERQDGLALVTHVGRPDEQVHRFRDAEVMVIVAGPHGYVSPSWYSAEATRVPTWNFSVAHLWGVPQILEQDENLAVLERLVDHFERHVDRPVALDAQSKRLVSGTVGLRIPVERFVCKVKMSQEEDPQSQRQVLAALRAPGPYASAPLADAIEAELARRAGG